MGKDISDMLLTVKMTNIRIVIRMDSCEMSKKDGQGDRSKREEGR